MGLLTPTRCMSDCEERFSKIQTFGLQTSNERPTTSTPLVQHFTDSGPGWFNFMAPGSVMVHSTFQWWRLWSRHDKKAREQSPCLALLWEIPRKSLVLARAICWASVKLISLYHWLTAIISQLQNLFPTAERNFSRLLNLQSSCALSYIWFYCNVATENTGFLFAGRYPLKSAV